MSYSIGMDTIHLRPTPRLAHTEYCDHAPLRRAVTAAAGSMAGRAVSFEYAWELDLVWNTNDGPVPWPQLGRTTDMGHAEFMEGGVDRRLPKLCPFRDVEEVWAFDAMKEYALTPFDELVRYYEHLYRQCQDSGPELIFPGGYYKTVISGAIESFGWEMLLEAAADRVKFARVLETFAERSLYYFRAWAKTSAPVFICHDDFVWSEGAFLHPDFYRRAIIPHYRELWSVLRQAGKKVLFCSDANWIEFVDDIAAAGADGFIFEPMMPLEPVVARYGKTHVIVSSKVDARTLTFGTPSMIRAEVDATLKLAFDCPGFIFAVGNHLPCNVPLDNALYYFDYLRKNWKRP